MGREGHSHNNPAIALGNACNHQEILWSQAAAKGWLSCHDGKRLVSLHGFLNFRLRRRA
jgi:hypothetical protein